MLLPLASALLVAACAHAPARQHAARSEAVAVGDVAVVVRWTDADEQVARRLRRALPAALAAAQRWGPLSGPLAITIHPTHEALEDAARRPGYPWLRAWARPGGIELQSPRTWSGGDATDDQLAQLLAHELTHCVMFQAVGDDARLARTIPVWFREGMATASAGERFAAESSAGTDLTARALLARSEPASAYAAADRAFRLLAARHGEGSVRLLLARVRAGEEFPAAFRAVTGVTLRSFEDGVAAEATRGGAIAGRPAIDLTAASTPR